ncbi:unannotated protein [freshwater metagenome]|uniref:Unannotated protein n=1 Tax=freshwater metagenome TaxID=449393 RepID=A0A6J7RDM9_9ZZZZ
MTANQMAMIGPNTLPMLAVPRRCTANRPMMMTTAIGTTQSSRRSVLTLVPSTADNTEMAGVIMPSP